MLSGDACEPDLRSELVIEIDGEDVHIDTLDAPSVLNLAVAYLDLLTRCAATDGVRIKFYGLHAFEKCGAIGTRPSDPEVARLAVLEASTILSSLEMPLPELKGALDRVREARKVLPSHYKAMIKIGDIERQILAEPEPKVAERPYAVASIRAYVQRVGGTAPLATFSSKSERNPFHLDLKSVKQAIELGAHLYRPVDIVALVVRDREGHIEGGELRDFQPVLEGDARSAWSEWFRESGVKSVDDLEEKKGGRND